MKRCLQAGVKWGIICCYHLMNGSKYKNTIRTFEPQKQKIIRTNEPGKNYLVPTKKSVHAYMHHIPLKRGTKMQQNERQTNRKLWPF